MQCVLQKPRAVDSILLGWGDLGIPPVSSFIFFFAPSKASLAKQREVASSQGLPQLRVAFPEWA